MTIEDDEARQSPRDSLFLLSVLRDENGVEVGPAKVRNLSSTGMMVETSVALSLGERLRFDLRGIGEVRGVVVREERDRFRYGIHFERPVDARLARRAITGTSTVRPPPPRGKYPV